jgi:hypothetical protein
VPIIIDNKDIETVKKTKKQTDRQANKEGERERERDKERERKKIHRESKFYLLVNSISLGHSV